VNSRLDLVFKFESIVRIGRRHKLMHMKKLQHALYKQTTQHVGYFLTPPLYHKPVATTSTFINNAAGSLLYTGQHIDRKD
jgi:hypothetical protein